MVNDKNEIYGDNLEEGKLSYLINTNTGTSEYSIVPYQNKISYISNKLLSIYNFLKNKFGEIKLLNNVVGNPGLAGYSWAIWIF